jgi:hypothetical protein
MALSNKLTTLIPIVRTLIKDQARSDGRDAFEFDDSPDFTLSETFINEDSIKVFLNGELMDDDDWNYDSDTNQVKIDFAASGEELQKNDILVITYSFYKKYSDDELKNYISSSLVYFAMHKYGRVFEVDTNENIICVNDLNPTNEELYFMAIIASIVVDPQNIDISIDSHFRVSATRDKSDQEQIALAFSQFKRLVGKVYFERSALFTKNW